MKCPDCGEVINDPSMAIIGQSMCPSCGNILDFTDVISNEVSDNEEYETY
jgi:predicted  nucleic acid-binding Zn-ribbon protein